MRSHHLALLLAFATACNLVRGEHDSNRSPPPAAQPPGPRFINDDSKASLDVVTYAKLCKQELGLPVDTVLAPWNCLEGVEVPITIDGKPLDAANYEELKAGKLGCDRPSWLGDVPCANYGFVQHRELAPGVHAALLCRLRGFTSHKTSAERRADYVASGTFADFRSLYDFDSLGLIWSNTTTGKTCFFDIVGKLYGGYVPSPDETNYPAFTDLPEPRPPQELAPGTQLATAWRKNGRDQWKPPAEMAAADSCVKCHDSRPFKSSPWMEQAFPVPNPPLDVPLVIVGKAYDPWREKHPAVAISTTPVDGAPQLCTSCHRIGSHDTCKNHIDYSIGARFPSVVSKLAETYPHKAWMPPADAPDEASWKAVAEKHVKKLTCCCKTPNAIGCTRQDLATAPLPAPVAGTGPETCE